VPTFYDGRVRLNVRGRERDGVVAPEDFDRVCDEVIAAVGACRDPRTGAPILAEAIRLEGADADLQLIWTHETDAWEHPDAGLIGPFPYRRTGGHSRRGFAFIAGDDIVPGDLGAHAALDVTPTILALLDRDPPAPMHGRSLLPRRSRTAQTAPRSDDATR
jgi:predicted AlkP superfamily phosphohydrolase/phosphomutase